MTFLFPCDGNEALSQSPLHHPSPASRAYAWSPFPLARAGGCASVARADLHASMQRLSTTLTPRALRLHPGFDLGSASPWQKP